MPLRPSTIVRGIPFFPIPQSVMPGICTHSDDILRVIVRKTRSHFSNASIRTRSIKWELMRMETPAGAPVPDRSGDNEGNRGGCKDGNCSGIYEENRGGRTNGEDGECI